MLRSAALALALLASTALPAFAQWSFVGGDGETVTLDAVPTRIIASQDAAAGLIPLGIRPVAIYADSAVADAKALQGLDLTGIEIIGQAWGEVDVEKAAALEPDLIVAEFWPLETTWSGGNDVVTAHPGQGERRNEVRRWRTQPPVSALGTKSSTPQVRSWAKVRG